MRTAARAVAGARQSHVCGQLLSRAAAVAARAGWAVTVVAMAAVATVMARAGPAVWGGRTVLVWLPVDLVRDGTICTKNNTHNTTEERREKSPRHESRVKRCAAKKAPQYRCAHSAEQAGRYGNRGDQGHARVQGRHR